MNRNIISIFLIIVALGLTFTFTKGQYDDASKVQSQNNQYRTAIDNSLKLIESRDRVLATYNSIDDKDKENLRKMLPDNVDNVRLIIDVSDVIEKHNTTVKSIKASAEDSKSTVRKPGDNSRYSTVNLNFSVSTTYENFVSILKSLETSLRVIDISRISFSSSDMNSVYDFNVDLKTYWLKQ